MSDAGQDRLTFRCEDCGATLAIDRESPPKDDEMFNCNGCGRAIAKYGDLKQALIKAGKEWMENEVSRAFGKPVKLDWKNDE